MMKGAYMYSLLLKFSKQFKSSVLPFIFLLFITFSSTLFADTEPNNNCSQAEIVSSLNGASPSLTKTFSGTAHQTSDPYDYYKFTVATSGILDFSYTANKTNASLFIGSTCGGSEYYSDTSDSDTKNSDSFYVSAGDTIYVVVQRRYTSSMEYDITVNFTAPSFSGDNFKDFSILYSENLRGDIRMIGNTILGERQNSSTTKCPGNTTNNSAITSRYWDTDGISSTFNSSSSNLTIPTGATIKKAFLYWQGRAATDEYANAKTIKFKQPGASDYTTLTASNNDIHWHSYGSYYPYKASVEVTSLINGSGTYTAADITTYSGGNPDELGAFGAWSLVVVYAKDDELLQNITVYNGYRTIAQNNSQNFTLSGFLTPSNGNVNSKFLIFTGEGDVDLLGDYVKMSGTRITRFNDNYTNSASFNTFSSSITENDAYVTTRNPICQNNVGIDIHSYNVGTTGLNIIKNNQTSTTLEIGTNADVYYLTVFAFATELYEPRVCYFIDTIKQKDTNTTIFENKKFVGEVATDTEYTFDIWISNMKKNSTDSFIEIANLVQVYMNMTDVDYTEESMSMQNLGETGKSTLSDEAGVGLGEFSENENRLTWRVGLEASGSHGGTIAPASSFTDDTKKAFITYKGKFEVEESTTNIDLVNFFNFKASFQTDSITIGSDNAQIIEQCVDLNTSANVAQPPKGVFNVVNENFTGGSLSSDSDTALFTQVSGQPFNVKIVALENNFQTLKSHTGDVNLSIITTPAYTGDPTGDQALCDGASGGIPIPIQFNGETVKTQTLTINDAIQSASFKVSFANNGLVKHICATDSFAIRPAGYGYTFTPSAPLVGGRAYTLASTALNSFNTQTPSYAGTASQTISLIIPPTCGLAPDTNSTIISFIGGLDTSFLRTGNIGDYNITVTDTSWTSIDEGTGHGDDCIVGSFENLPSGGLVGCNTQTSQTFKFNPKDFSNTLTVQNFNSGNFTYISNDNTMSASALATITARLDDNTTATAYTANCYANDINTTTSLIKEPLPIEWLNNETNATNRIRFFADGVTTNSELNATGSSIFSTTQNNFNNGIANITIMFNFDRNITIPDEPFHIAKNDFNITVIDENGLTGVDFNRSIDQNTTFYYGRAHAPDYRFSGNIGTAMMYYEVYAKDLNQSQRVAFGITGNQGIDSVNWYQNALHVNTAGTTNPFSATITIGAQTNATTSSVVLTHAPPHVGKVNLGSNSWLNHYPTDFTVEFYSSGSWAGSGFVKQGQPNATDTNTTVGEHIHKTAPVKANRRMTW